MARPAQVRAAVAALGRRAALAVGDAERVLLGDPLAVGDAVRLDLQSHPVSLISRCGGQSMPGTSLLPGVRTFQNGYEPPDDVLDGPGGELAQSRTARGSGGIVRRRRTCQRARGGDRRAFDAIFRRHHRDLYRYCRAILGNGQEAEDALQSTMLKALRALPGERREIALRAVVVQSRPQRGHRAAAGPARARGAGPRTDRRPRRCRRSGGDPRAAAPPGGDLRDLPERQRSALVMRELNGLAFAEIAATFEITESAAKQTVYEARTSLHRMAEGRDMDCEPVRQAISAADRRRLRSRRIRAHLRECSSCRAFESSIAQRRARPGRARAPDRAAGRGRRAQGEPGGPERPAPRGRSRHGGRRDRRRRGREVGGHRAGRDRDRGRRCRSQRPRGSRRLRGRPAGSWAGSSRSAVAACDRRSLPTPAMGIAAELPQPAASQQRSKRRPPRDSRDDRSGPSHSSSDRTGAATGRPTQRRARPRRPPARPGRRLDRLRLRRGRPRRRPGRPRRRLDRRRLRPARRATPIRRRRPGRPRRPPVSPRRRPARPRRHRGRPRRHRGRSRTPPRSTQRRATRPTLRARPSRRSSSLPGRGAGVYLLGGGHAAPNDGHRRNE